MQAFGELAAFPGRLTEALSRLVLTEILPAAQSGDFAGFARAVGEYGARVGAAFASVQAGVVHPQSQELWRRLHEWEIPGVAQTSWGPTLAIPCPTATAAGDLVERLRSSPGCAELLLETTAVRNQGVEIQLDDGHGAPSPP
jgi:predicted sugar kinase